MARGGGGDASGAASEVTGGVNSETRMSKFSILACVTAMVGGLASAANAADSNGDFAVKGVGTSSCRDYLEARAAGGDAYLLYGGYIGGYVTAFNQLRSDTFDVLAWQTVDTLTRMLASFCEKRPGSRFAAVLAHLAELLEPERITRKSPGVGAGAPGPKVTPKVIMYVEALRRLQVKLAQLGLYHGQPHGSFDSGTRESLERFQRAHELPPTGVPDQVTLFVLRYPPGRAAELLRAPHDD